MLFVAMDNGDRLVSTYVVRRNSKVPVRFLAEASVKELHTSFLLPSAGHN